MGPRQRHRRINLRYDTSWKLQLISSFHWKFDVPCVKEISTERVRIQFQCKASFHVHLTFLVIPNAWLKTFFLTRSVEISFTHVTSMFQRKLQINWSFQLVSHLWFIVLWWRFCLGSKNVVLHQKRAKNIKISIKMKIDLYYSFQINYFFSFGRAICSKKEPVNHYSRRSP